MAYSTWVLRDPPTVVLSVFRSQKIGLPAVGEVSILTVAVIGLVPVIVAALARKG